MDLNIRKNFNEGGMTTYAHLFDSTAFRTPNLNLFLWDKVMEKIMPRNLLQVGIASHIGSSHWMYKQGGRGPNFTNI